MFESIFAGMKIIDIEIMKMIQSVGPSWYLVGWFLSAIIGSLKFLAPASILALLLMNKKRIALEIFIITIISIVSIYGLKLFIEAPRPDLALDGLAFQYLVEEDFGMPSAHAFISVVVFGWLWFKHPRSPLLIVGSTIIILLIGISRIYLGVHYPSQVLVGWLIGIVFLIFFRRLDKKLWMPFRNRLD